MCYACKSEKLVNNLKHLFLSLSLSHARSKNSLLHSVALLGCNLEELGGSMKAIISFFSITFC